MSEQEFNELNDTIIKGLEIAENEMLAEKARRGENVIIGSCNSDIRSVPANQFL